MKDSKSNSELIKLFKAGDIVAFDAIYERYCRRLFGFVLQYLKNQEDTKEIIQEVFLKIWEARRNINNYSTFDSFIFTVAYNSTISLLRKRLTERKYLENLKLRQKISASPGLIDEIQFKDLDEKVQSLLIRLTPRQREIFHLSREEGLTHGEIAKKLNISTNTVKNQIVTVLTFLRSELNSELLVNFLFICFFI